MGCRLRPWQPGHSRATGRAGFYGAVAIFAALFISGILLLRRLLRSNRALEDATAAARLSLVAVEQNPIGVVMTDLAGTITYVNPAFIQMSGLALAKRWGKLRCKAPA